MTHPLSITACSLSPATRSWRVVLALGWVLLWAGGPAKADVARFVGPTQRAVPPNLTSGTRATGLVQRLRQLAAPTELGSIHSTAGVSSMSRSDALVRPVQYEVQYEEVQTDDEPIEYVASGDTGWNDLLTDASRLFTEEPGDSWQLLPDGLLYRTYLAGEKESRFQSVWLHDPDLGWKWETELGGRVGLVRFGTNDTFRPEGFQLDLEGAAHARVDPVADSNPLEATDFRVGMLGNWRRGRVAIKTGYTHLSSHAGDEFLLNNPGYQRLNYVRDSWIIGTMVDLFEDVQVYSEMGYALIAEDGAEPLEFQYGIQYSTYAPTGARGAPFLAANGHTRQDFDWITSLNVTAGWQWRGRNTSHLWRIGMQYYTGPALQWEFAGTNESLIGLGFWYDY